MFKVNKALHIVGWGTRSRTSSDCLDVSEFVSKENAWLEIEFLLPRAIFIDTMSTKR